MICDEVMAGFGRCGEWFAVEHWGVSPTSICFAKGVNSRLRAARRRRHQPADRRHVRRPRLPRRAHLLRATRWRARRRSRASTSSRRRASSSTRACSAPTSSAPALEKLQAEPSERRRGPRPRRVLGARAGPATARRASRSCRTTLSGADAKPMADLGAACKQRGLWPFTHFNRLHVVPPCTATTDEVLEGLAILDEALAVADSFYTG